MDTLKHYLPLCWLKLNPLDLPRSVVFLKQNLWIYFIVEFFLQANMTDDPIESFVEVTIETLLTFVLIGILLYLNKTMYDYIQVSSALLFTSNVVSVVIIPVLVWLTITENTISYYLLGLALFWEFAIVAYILRLVIGINVPASMVMSLVYFGATYYGAYTLGQLI